MRCTVYIATSLDGYIARTDGGIDWLPIPKPGEDDYGYGEFMKTVDAVVMGRNTFELVLTYDEWPYTKPVVVLTSRPGVLPSPLPPGVRALSGAPDDIIADLERTGAKHLYVDGGVTIQRFLAAGRIGRMIITRIPVLIGSGLPLFGTSTRDVVLRHVQTRSFPNGLVQSEYLVSET
jgi:dihydrofolate reductase